MGPEVLAAAFPQLLGPPYALELGPGGGGGLGPGVGPAAVLLSFIGPKGLRVPPVVLGGPLGLDVLQNPVAVFWGAFGMDLRGGGCPYVPAALMRS